MWTHEQETYGGEFARHWTAAETNKGEKSLTKAENFLTKAKKRLVVNRDNHGDTVRRWAGD